MPITLTTQKQLPKAQQIVMISDVHLGYHNRKEEFKRWVQLINDEKPDLVLISGDIVDGNLRPLWEENMAQEFRKYQGSYLRMSWKSRNILEANKTAKSL